MKLIYITSLLLFIIGLINLFGIEQSLVISQLAHFCVGIVIFLLIKMLGVHFFKRNAVVVYGVFIILLILTTIIGLNIQGSQRWIDFYFFRFQTSEFFKIGFLLFYSQLFVEYKRYIKSFWFFLLTFFAIFIPTFLVYKQPDLGSSIIYIVLYISLMTFSGTKMKYLFYLGGTVALSIPALWFILKDYQRDRIIAFINPNVDTLGSSYNMMQSIITVGSGSFMGRGLGLGTQSQLAFLPEYHTDFAFASLVEQFGFIGGFSVIILYSLLAYGLARKIIANHSKTTDEGQFYFYMYLGTFTYVTFQFIVNVGMNMGLMPITGIPLPLISYGGSALVTWIIILALLK